MENSISTKDMELLKSKYPDIIDEIIDKINNGYPIQYLIGNVEFLNTTINVDERVLIPRYETELLVDKTIKYIKKYFKKEVNIIDLGTGSGCIAIALKKALDCNVTALDISKDALEVARDNAKLNEVDINFVEGGMLDELKDNYDVIISNPPYIPFDGFVEDIVKNNEPNVALFAPDEGIFYYKEIIKFHMNNLNKPGIMAFEIGDNEEELLTTILEENNISNYKFEKDLTDRIRYLFIFNV